MADVALVYPYFYSKAKDKSIFKFPPLGLGYIAAALNEQNISVDLIDGSFITPDQVIEQIKRSCPQVVGFYAMLTMEHHAVELARQTRDLCELQVAGGPYPTASPGYFLSLFDMVALGEGEKSLPQLVKALHEGKDLRDVPGFAYSKDSEVKHTPSQPRIEQLDRIAFPARSGFDDKAYKEYWRKNYGHTMTSMITTRGCPFKCGFCSKPVFGDDYRERSAANVVDEIQEILALDYERIWMADDCFTLNRKRVVQICDEILKRGLKFEWECLSRADGVEPDMLNRMREAGCSRLFFGLESGNDNMLEVMNKNTTVASARTAVGLAFQRGLKTGGFFILGYPGETDETLIETVNFSSSLPLDYLSYTVPYPLPGTDLYRRLKDRLNSARWESPKNHRLLYRSDFSMNKLNLAMAKGKVQHWLRSRMGTMGAALERPFRWISDGFLKLIS